MGRISKIAAATALSAAALGVNTPTALGEPVSPPPQLSPGSDQHVPGKLSEDTASFNNTSPSHFAPLHLSSTPKPRLLMIEKTTGVNTSITFTPMEHSPLGRIPLLPGSVKLSPHGSLHSWSVNSLGEITFNPDSNFQGTARASYSIEDAAGTIFTSSIAVQVS